MTRKSRLKRAAVVSLSCLLWNMPLGFAAELSLDQAIDMALGENPSVKIAVKGEEKARVQLEGAKGRQQMEISASSSLGLTDLDDRGSTRNNSNSVRLSLPIYTGGKNELTIKKAEDAVSSSGLNVGRTRENIKLDTTVAFYKILETDKVVKVNEETVSNYEEHLKNVQALYAAGSAPKVDVLRSEVELADAKQKLISARNAYEVAVSKLKSIVKMDAEEPLTLIGDADYIEFSAELAECIAYARENRKDLAQYRLAVEQAKKDVGIAKSDKLPSVSLSVGNSWDKELLPDRDNHSLSASVSASWNIFDSNVTDSNIKAAEIAVDEAVLELEKQTDAAELAVREAYLNMREAEERFAATEVAALKAEEDYFIASEKYKAGEGLMLDIIDAQLALKTARTNDIQARYDYVTYRATLENAMGVGEEDGR